MKQRDVQNHFSDVLAIEEKIYAQAATIFFT
jgi:hypothetical protein